jgi:hypothetical protein
MSKQEQPRVPIQRSDETSTQDGMSSFTVWSNTTMLGQEDDTDQAGNDVVLRGID